MEQKTPDHEQSEERKHSRWGFRGMTVRDWLQLLIVPLALVVIGFVFTMQQDARQQEIENQRAEVERELAEQRAQDEALQAYLDQMSTLLMERDLRLSTEDNATEASKEARTLARARTLTVLVTLDGSRKGRILHFLYTSGLIAKENPIVLLDRAHLAQAVFRGANLKRANLAGANLIEADLGVAVWDTAYNPQVPYQVYRVEVTSLVEANLEEATLGRANLAGADLTGANLTGANLAGANLAGANLTKARVTEEQLSQAKSLEGATMPNGQKYEE